MPSNPLTQSEVNDYTIGRILTPSGELIPYLPPGYFLATPPVGDGPALWRLFDPEYIQGIIPADKLGTGSLGLGNLYLADDGTWKGVTVATPTLDQVTTAGNVTLNTIDVGGVKSDYFLLDTLATPTLQPGMFGWNDIDGTADLRLKGGNVTLQLGQETVARVVNKTGANLLESEYKVVRVRIASEGGAQGQRLAVVLAQGNNDPDSVTTLGIVTENIANNQEGFITVFGNVNGINTTGSLQGETWVDGDVLFLSPTTPGSLTNVKPQAPNHTVVMGYVIYAHSVNGKIFVKVDNGYEIDELHNVKINSVAGNDLLQYDSTLQVWKNVAASVAVPTPTLAQVTTAGNTTTNAINTGLITTTTSAVGNMFAANGANNTSLTVSNDSFGRAYIAIKGNLSATSAAGAYFTAEGYQEAWFNVYAKAANTGNKYWRFGNIGSGTLNNVFAIQKLTDDGSAIALTALTVFSSNGNIGINTTTDAGYKLDVNGTGRYVGSLNVWRNTTTNGFILSSGSNDTLQWNNGTWDIQFNSGTPVTILRLSNGVGGVSYLTSKINVNAPNVISNLGASLGVYGNIITSGSITASSAIARGVYFNNTLVAAANNDVLVGLDINPTFTNGAFTGVNDIGLRVLGDNVGGSSAYSVYAYGGQAYFRGNFSNNTGFSLLVQNRGNATSFGVRGDGVALAVGGVSVSDGTNKGLDISYSGVGGYKMSIAVSDTGVSFSNSAGASRPVSFSMNTGEILRIHQSYTAIVTNNFLIGTTTDAGYKLNVNGSIALSGNLVPTGGSQSLGTFTNRFGDLWAGGLIVGTTFYGDNLQSASGNLYFKEGSGLEKMRMLANGNFLIGTTTDAGYRVDVSGTLRSTADAYFATASGNVGVGTVSPQYKFDVRATSVKVQIRSTAESENATLFLGTPFNSTALPKVAIIAKAQSSWSRADLYFCVSDNSSSNTVEATTSDAKMVILSAGNVGIGNTAPSYKLDVSGDVNTSGVFRVGGVAGWTGTINIPTNPPGQQNIQVSGGIITNVS